MNARPHPCLNHGDLVYELVLGRLADADARHAEQALAGCESCRTRYAEMTRQAALDHPEVARGVAEGIAAFRTPAERPAVRPAAGITARRWPLRAAAVLALAAGGAAAWTAREALSERAADGGGTARAAEVILAEDLESGDLGELEPTRRPEVIFADGLESGDLGAWRSSS